jgi:hypothetical protein
LIESLREADRTESIGAATVLAFLLPDSDLRTSEVENFLLASPYAYITSVFDTRTQRERYGFHRLTGAQEWLLQTAIKTLLGPHWFELGNVGVAATKQLLSHSESKSLDVARKNGLSASQNELLRLLIKQPEADERRDIEEIEYGFVKARKCPCDWTGSLFETPQWWDDSDLQNAPGILQLIYRILNFGRNRSKANLQSVISMLDEVGVDMLDAMPPGVHRLIPFDEESDLASVMSHLRGIDQPAIDLLCSTGRSEAIHLSRPYSDLTLNMESTIEQWRRLVGDMPSIALHLWGDSLWTDGRKRPNLLDSDDAVAALIDRLSLSPPVLMRFPYLWGRLIERSESRQSNLRSALRDAAQAPVADISMWRNRFHLIKLDLPNDAALLPHILNCLVAKADASQPRKPPTSILRDVATIVDGMVGDLQSLQKVAQNYKQDTRVRAAASMLLLLHPEGHSKLSELYQPIVGFHGAEIGMWYFKAVCFCIRLLGSESDPSARLFVGSLLDVTRADYLGRAEIQQLLTQWRETSNAPAQKVSAFPQWLEQSPT